MIHISYSDYSTYLYFLPFLWCQKYEVQKIHEFFYICLLILIFLERYKMDDILINNKNA